MRRFLLHISSAMLAVVLATVLAPSFAWESVAGKSAHIDCPESYGSVPEPQEHHGAPGRGDTTSQHQHPCAGHALGHLTVMIGTSDNTSSTSLSNEVARDQLSRIRSYAPRVPEHPPQALPLA
jgi:hypothetical protein